MLQINWYHEIRDDIIKMLNRRGVTMDGAASCEMLFTFPYSAWFGFLLIRYEGRDDGARTEKYRQDWNAYKRKVNGES